ncbi:MAG: DUF1223 domain-containing protein [Pseudomonadota bacterium]
MNRPIAASLLALLIGAPALAQAAQTCSAHSPAHGVALLELYTSEGCDSCPPADQFVSSLRAAGVGPAQAVLLALHVDYWNNADWKDPFSRATFTQRQHQLAELAGAGALYTPEIFIAAKEVRGDVQRWSRAVPEAVKRVNAKPARAAIAITLGQAGADGLPVEVTASAAEGGTLYVALVQSGLINKVAGGENVGRALRHDFVVREWLAPLALAGADGAKPGAALKRTVALPAGALPKDLAVSAFVQSRQGEVLQAFALPVCGN